MLQLGHCSNKVEMGFGGRELRTASFWVLLWLGGAPSPQSLSGGVVVLTVK